MKIGTEYVDWRILVLYLSLVLTFALLGNGMRCLMVRFEYEWNETLTVEDYWDVVTSCVVVTSRVRLNWVICVVAGLEQ